MLAIADAGPLQYLVLVAHADVLGHIFTGVAIPSIVRAELSHRNTPAAVRSWIAAPPLWLSVVPHRDIDPVGTLSKLDPGERAVIALAEERRPALVLMDDRAGVVAARAAGFAVTGTAGLLYRAAKAGLVDLPEAFARLKATNFRHGPGLLDGLLARFAAVSAAG